MRDGWMGRKGVANRAALSVVIAIAVGTGAATTVSAQILGGDGHDVNLPGGSERRPPGRQRRRRRQPPRWHSVHLPGGSGADHDVNLPGGSGVDLPGGDQTGAEPHARPGPHSNSGARARRPPRRMTGPRCQPTTPARPPARRAPAAEARARRPRAGQRGHRHGGRGHGDHEDLGETDPGQVSPPPLREPTGAPKDLNPSLTVADFGPAPIGVPNFVIDQFTIPPFLLPIYQACGTQYGIPWQVLASINRIETAFGTNLNVSTAGALGWMQFMPATWETYGVDANNDGRKDPYNPVDAICAAAGYLKAAGGDTDLRTAIFAYNHADWYVDEVLLYANQYERLPADLVSSLTGLTEGARFPVAADARYADDITERRLLERVQEGKRVGARVSDAVASSPRRRAVDIFADAGSPVLAVNDGVVQRIGNSRELGRYIVLQDTYGNRYTYAQLGRTARAYPAPRNDGATTADYELPKEDAKPATDAKGAKAEGPANTQDTRRRLFALPDRQRAAGPRDMDDTGGMNGGLDDELFGNFPNFERFRAYTSGILKFNRKTMELRPLREGSQVVAGTLLGRVGDSDALAPHVNFSIRPAGRGAPSIDPKPILDGWKLLEATALYRVADKDPFATDGDSISEILLLSKEQLAERVLDDPSLEIYECGRQDIQTGQIDRRILALLEYLVGRGYKLTITSLKCGHSVMTTSGNVSEHTIGSAVDIAAINGVPVYGHQGPGTLADSLIRDILDLQGTMVPHQIISLMDYFDADNTFAMADHDDHVHVGYAQAYGSPSSLSSSASSAQLSQVLKPDQWRRLIGQLSEIDNPRVSAKPSKFSLPAGENKDKHGKDRKRPKGRRASPAHRGE